MSHACSRIHALVLMRALFIFICDCYKCVCGHMQLSFVHACVCIYHMHCRLHKSHAGTACSYHTRFFHAIATCAFQMRLPHAPVRFACQLHLTDGGA